MSISLEQIAELEGSSAQKVGTVLAHFYADEGFAGIVLRTLPRIPRIGTPFRQALEALEEMTPDELDAGLEHMAKVLRDLRSDTPAITTEGDTDG